MSLRGSFHFGIGGGVDVARRGKLSLMGGGTYVGVGLYLGLGGALGGVSFLGAALASPLVNNKSRAVARDEGRAKQIRTRSTSEPATMFVAVRRPGILISIAV
jgi:hypothetical protein